MTPPTIRGWDGTANDGYEPTILTPDALDELSRDLDEAALRDRYERAWLAAQAIEAVKRANRRYDERLANLRLAAALLAVSAAVAVVALISRGAI